MIQLLTWKIVCADDDNVIAAQIKEAERVRRMFVVVVKSWG